MSHYRGKVCAVTGAGGFIGSHLCEALADAGAKVRALVRYTSTSSRGHLAELSPERRAAVEIRMGDVTDVSCVRSLVAGADVVFHLAALIGIPYSYEAPRQYVAPNVGGVVHTSTSEVYGTARTTPIDEAHPLQAQSPYAATKIGADKLCESYFLSFGLPVVTVRPFNTYGPRQSARAIIPTVMAQLAAGRSSVRIGSPDPMRDMNFVGDTVAGFLAAGACDAALGQVVNLGTGRAIRIGDLARKIFEIAGTAATLETDDARVRPDGSEVMLLLADARRAKELCGWEPKVTLEEGLERTYAYVKGHLAAYRPDEYAV